METRSTCGGLELRESENGPTRITGYAARFYNPEVEGTEFRLWPGAVERIMPSAFNSFRDHDVRALFNHDSNMVLGRSTAGTLKLMVDESGLRYEITPSESPIYQNVLAMIARGDVDGSSFQFSIDDEKWTKEGEQEVREIHGVTLYHVGPVTFPAYDAATSEAASVSGRNARESHELWRIRKELEDVHNRRRGRHVALAALGLRIYDPE